MVQDFFKLVHVKDAVRLLLDAIGEPAVEAQEEGVSEALGRVVAAEVVAPEDLPGFHRSSMDGYAVRAEDTFGASEGLPAYLEMTGEVMMGESSPAAVGLQEASRISTGGVLPPGSDAVVMVENTEESGGTIEVVKPVAPGENVILPDEDIRAGSIVLEPGQVVGPAQVGALTALGITKLEVFRLPVVAIVSTGDELVSPDSVPGPGKVRDVNTASLSAALADRGCEARSYGIVKDDFESLMETCALALGECDALLISGGSSMGVRDVTVEVLKKLGPPGLLAHGIYLKPGKPTLVSASGKKPVIGLPGNPASALVVFREVLWPVMARLRGEAAEGLTRAPRVTEAVLERSVPSAPGRMELVPVALRREAETLVAYPILGMSSLIGTLCRANGNVRIEEGSEGLYGGQVVSVELID